MSEVTNTNDTNVEKPTKAKRTRTPNVKPLPALIPHSEARIMYAARKGRAVSDASKQFRAFLRADGWEMLCALAPDQYGAKGVAKRERADKRPYTVIPRDVFLSAVDPAHKNATMARIAKPKRVRAPKAA